MCAHNFRSKYINKCVHNFFRFVALYNLEVCAMWSTSYFPKSTKYDYIPIWINLVYNKLVQISKTMNLLLIKMEKNNFHSISFFIFILQVIE